jgi:hypothetical protein
MASVNTRGLFTASRVRSARVTLLGAAAAGSLAACGLAGGFGPDEPPDGLIGFVGGLGPGVGFVHGGKGADAGAHPGDASVNPHPDAGGEPPDASAGGGEDAYASMDSAPPTDAGDGGSSVGVVLNLPPGFFMTLYWTIAGPPGTYSGMVDFGAARSIEFVVGGINAGDGYKLTLTGTDPSGDLCMGTSAPFSVEPGATTSTGVDIQCFIGDAGPQAAPITTGNVAVDAGVVQP